MAVPERLYTVVMVMSKWQAATFALLIFILLQGTFILVVVSWLLSIHDNNDPHISNFLASNRLGQTRNASQTFATVLRYFWTPTVQKAPLLMMPWETGLWSKRAALKLLSKPPTLKEVAAYANALVWHNEPDALFSERRARWMERMARDYGPPATQPLRLLHVINPFFTPKKHVEATQKMAMASIESARAWMDYMDPLGVQVDVVVIELDDGKYSNLLRPATFKRATQRLKATVMDLINQTSFSRNFSSSARRHRLPLLKDILLSGLQEASNSSSGKPYDHLIFTNMDINVMPSFYAIVAKLLTCHKTFFINRVEIPDTKIANPARFHLGQGAPIVSEPINLQSIASAYDLTLQFGQNHPGYDCFVAPTYLVQRIAYKVGQVFIGYPPCGAILAEAAKLVDRQCITARKIPVTFHVGSRNGEWEGREAENFIQLNGALARQQRPKKMQKCRSIAIRGKGFGLTKCFPLHFYPIPPSGGKAMFPEDYKLSLQSRNSSLSRMQKNVHK